MRTIIIGIIAGLLALGLFVFVMVPGRHQQFLKNKADFVHTSRFWIMLMTLLVPFYIFVCSRPTWYNDYYDFIYPWILYIREHGGWASLGHTYSNYQPSYLYILTAISYLPCNYLVPVRLVSILFSGIGGYYAGKIIYLRRREKWVVPCALFTSLALPTVWLNGAYWAQCDSIYTSFIIIGIYCLLTSRQTWAWIWLGVAFSFKLQTAFIVPLFILLWLHGDSKWWMPFVALGAVMLMWFPAMLLGKPLHDFFYVYQEQANDFSVLAISLPNIWCLLPEGTPCHSWIAILSILLIAVLGIWIFVKTRNQLYSREFLVAMAMIVAFAVPFFLPKMHERYIYLADVFALVFIAYYPGKWWVAAVSQILSLSGYMQFLAYRSKYMYFNFEYADFLPYSILYTISVAILLIFLFRRCIPSLKHRLADEKLY